MSNTFTATKAKTEEALGNISTSNRRHYQGDHPTRRYDTPEEEIIEHAAKNSKICSKCDVEKCLLDFSLNTCSSCGFDQDGFRLRRNDCKVCQSASRKGQNEAKKWAKERGIPYKAPKGTCCAKCKASDRKLVFDHDHERNVFRGYLCDPCNRGMGLLGDGIEGLLEAVNYINQTEQKNIKVSDEGELYVAEEEEKK